MYRRFALHPDDGTDPYAFRVDLSGSGTSTARIVFGPEPRTGTTTAHLSLMPLSLQKQPATTNPRYWATGALGLIAVAATAAASRRHSRAGIAGQA
jgi:hypothetical protein